MKDKITKMFYWYTRPTLADAWDELAAGRRDRAVSIMHWHAQRGLVEAMHQLGAELLYPTGDESSSFEPDVAKAIAWLKQASDKGSVRAMSALWWAYLKRSESGVNKEDEALGLHYLMLAAERGDAWSQVFLGRCYADGTLVEKNPQTAFLWFQRAALADNSQGAADLAQAYRDGSGTARDVIKAYIWFSIAARYEVDHERKHFETLEVIHKRDPEWRPFPMEKEIKKGEHREERDKLAYVFSKEQLLHAIELYEQCYVRRGRGFE